MKLGERLRRVLGGEPKIRVTLLIKGRIGPGWQDVDRSFRLRDGATLGDLITLAEKRGVPIRAALEGSPHLRDTLMLNGERCPVSENADRRLEDGDQLYLLAPFAGG